MILWLPVALALGGVGAGALMTVSEMSKATPEEIGFDKDDPEWAFTLSRGIATMFLSVIGAALFVSCYLLAKLSLGL